MIFRAEESAQAGLERAMRYLIPGDATTEERAKVTAGLTEIIAQNGPVVDSYPTWHPLVPQRDPRQPQTIVSDRCGYERLDHTVYFVNAFLTCPYGNASRVIDSALRIDVPGKAGQIIAEEVDIPFYNRSATPVLVRMEWAVPLENGQQIPASRAVPLMLENEVPAWRSAERGESWEEMRHYLLGSPHGRRSSHFVSQATAIQLKKIYEAMNESGMYDR
jgi:hypothetical protein